MTANACVELEIIVTAQLPMPEAYTFRPEGGNAVTRLAAVLRPGAPTVMSQCLAFIVRHPSAGVILIDTGFHPDASTDPRRDFGLPMSLVFRGLRPTGEFTAQLADHEVAAGDVRQVVMTHLHVDHTSGMRLLPRAEFVCAREEWQAAHGRSAATKGYVASHLPPPDRVRLLELSRDGEPFGPFRRALDLLGDGSVRLLFTPGHSRGHLSVLLQHAAGRRTLIIGDAVYTLRSLREERLPLLTEDDEQYRTSLRQIAAFAAAEPAVELVPTHDPDAWRAVGKASGDG